jgi:hypothetical protein
MIAMIISSMEYNVSAMDNYSPDIVDLGFSAADLLLDPSAHEFDAVAVAGLVVLLDDVVGEEEV